jgi:hypothetical protein
MPIRFRCRLPPCIHYRTHTRLYVRGDDGRVAHRFRADLLVPVGSNVSIGWLETEEWSQDGFALHRDRVPLSLHLQGHIDLRLSVLFCLVIVGNLEMQDIPSFYALVEVNISFHGLRWTTPTSYVIPSL